MTHQAYRAFTDLTKAIFIAPNTKPRISTRIVLFFIHAVGIIGLVYFTLVTMVLNQKMFVVVQEMAGGWLPPRFTGGIPFIIGYSLVYFTIVRTYPRIDDKIRNSRVLNKRINLPISITGLIMLPVVVAVVVLIVWLALQS